MNFVEDEVGNLEQMKINIRKLYIRLLDINTKVSELYQSPKSNIDKHELLWMALIYVILGCFFLIIGKSYDRTLLNIIYKYFVITFINLSIFWFALYFYIYSKRKLSKGVTNVIIILYKIFFVECCCISIPVLLFLNIVKKIVNYRAKKMDNLMMWFTILEIDLSVILILGHFNIWCIDGIVKTLNFEIEKYEIVINNYAVMILVLLIMYKSEMDVTNICILKVIKKHGIAEIKKKVKKKKIDEINNFFQYTDLMEYVNKSNNLIQQYEEKQKSDLKYDLEYQKKTIWKFQLLCLIVLFVIATFLPDLLFKDHQGDAINVITIFTLVMLYMDKRKEWK